jgi:hypothetical protein
MRVNEILLLISDRSCRFQPLHTLLALPRIMDVVLIKRSQGFRASCETATQEVFKYFNTGLD